MNRKGIQAVASRELASYFTSPIAYIVITVFLLFTGFMFFKDFFYFNQAEMRNLFQSLPLMFTFFVPAVTMRLFSEEKQTGTIEMLLTMPLTVSEIVIGKYIAACVFIGAMLAPTLVYLFTVLLVGSPDMGPVAGGYLGALFLGSAMAGIGMITSALTRNQIVAFITAWAAGFFLWMINKITVFLPGVLSFLEQAGTDYHFQNISRGLIDTRDIIYFVSVAVISILLTVKILEERG